MLGEVWFNQGEDGLLALLIIRLLFVRDGERDAATILTSSRRSSALRRHHRRPWARLNQARRGYDRKLLSRSARARQNGQQRRRYGRARYFTRPDRIRDLQAARTKTMRLIRRCRLQSSSPTLTLRPGSRQSSRREPRSGCRRDSHPHRPPRGKPESGVGRLHRTSPRCGEPMVSLLVEIAQPSCRHVSDGRETGFAQFADDVRREIGPWPPRHRAPDRGCHAGRIISRHPRGRRASRHTRAMATEPAAPVRVWAVALRS